MGPITWLLIGLALLASEWVGASFDGLLPAAITALLISALSAVLPLPFPLQLLLFLLLTIGLLLAIRRWSASKPERNIPLNPGAERAVVIVGFDGSGAGRVRWQGQSWAALNLEPSQPLSPGSEVVVMGREGTRLQVLGSRVNP
ncbi:MAG: peptidase [Synechococcus sp. TMED19]|nr:MAG: peptidase [Synechococcus sp. TMED19]